MPLDGIFLNFLKNELEKSIVGSRVEKVHQPSRYELLFLLRSRSGASRLLVSASANCPRLHLTENMPENPPKPPMLCMLLRKNLCGSVITGITQRGLDRTVFIDFDATNEIGDKVKLRLCVEIMAKHSNIVLINGDGTIVDAIKRVDLSQSSYRQVLPSLPYVLPPAQDKLNIAQYSVEQIMQRLTDKMESSLTQSLQSVLEGASPLICREIAAAAGASDTSVKNLSPSQSELLKRSLTQLKALVESGGGQPFLLTDKNGKFTDFSYMDITQYGFSLVPEKKETFSSLLDNFYYEKDRTDRTHQRASDLIKAISNATARVSKKISLQQAELLECEERETLRIKAELINANLALLKKGAAFYDVDNYYDECKKLRIAADPALSPAANAQKYYKAYRKAKTAQQMLTELIENGGQELQYLETVADSLQRADTGAEIDEIRSELETAGYLKRHKKNDAKKQKPLAPLEYSSTDGFRIFVGRNNVQNDRLSLKTARAGDLWLHTQKIPGSHVIIDAQGREIPPSTIEQAAMLAAYHSKARESAQVPVDYTAAKNLKKPQGARPGKVIYHVYKTLTVTPQREYIKQLEVK